MPSRPGLGANEALIGVPGSRGALSTPALVLDLDGLEANIASMAEHARHHGYSLRPVVKVHKSPRIAGLQVGAGAIGVACSTLDEAEHMAASGITSILLFTSVVTEAKLARLATLNAAVGGVIVAADHAGNVLQLAEAARRSGTHIQVLVDLEVGDRRTGVPDPSAAVDLARLIEASDWLEYAGIQGYCGTHQVVRSYRDRHRLGMTVLDRLAQFVDALTAVGLPPRIITGGGTGSHDIDYERHLLTDLQVGSYALHDANYFGVALRLAESHPFVPALTVRTTVISDAQRGFVITDAGAKQVDGIFTPLTPLVYRGAPRDSTYAIVGDDMGRLTVPPPAAAVRVGHALELIPPHCYQTVIMYPYYHCVRGDALVDIWPIHSGLGGEVATVVTSA